MGGPSKDEGESFARRDSITEPIERKDSITEPAQGDEGERLGSGYEDETEDVCAALPCLREQIACKLTTHFLSCVYGWLPVCVRRS